MGAVGLQQLVALVILIRPHFCVPPLKINTLKTCFTCDQLPFDGGPYSTHASTAVNCNGSFQQRFLFCFEVMTLTTILNHCQNMPRHQRKIKASSRFGCLEVWALDGWLAGFSDDAKDEVGQVGKVASIGWLYHVSPGCLEGCSWFLTL